MMESLTESLLKQHLVKETHLMVGQRHENLLNEMERNDPQQKTSRLTNEIPKYKISQKETVQTKESLPQTRPHAGKFIVQHYKFVSYRAELTLEDSIRTITQVILDNITLKILRLLEVVDENQTNHLTSTFCNFAQFDHDVQVYSQISNQISTPDQTWDLIVLNHSSRKNKLLKQISRQKKTSFILSRESLNSKYNFEGSLEILSEHKTSNERLVLLKPTIRCKREVKVMNIHEWIRMKDTVKEELILLGYSNAESSFYRFCQRLLKQRNNPSRLFFGSFRPDNPSYIKQLNKGLVANVFKGGKWGTLVKFPREITFPVIRSTSVTLSDDYGDLRWFAKAPPKQNEKLRVHYSSLIFGDEKLFAYEYSGMFEDRRIFGVKSGSLPESETCVDEGTYWNLPEYWSLEDGCTIPLAYLVALWAFFEIAKLKSGERILIQFCCRDIGQAAINIASYYLCEIFVTVRSEEERAYVRKTYPHIRNSHIGFPKNSSYEQMILNETKGRGVDLILNVHPVNSFVSFRALSKGGRFTAIGKFNFDHLPTSLHSSISLYSICLDKELLQSLTREDLRAMLYHGIKIGYVKPLPRLTFQMEELEEMMETILDKSQRNKTLIKLRSETLSEELFTCSKRTHFKPEMSVVVIGCPKVFTVEIEAWFAKRNCTKIIFLQLNTKPELPWESPTTESDSGVVDGKDQTNEPFYDVLYHYVESESDCVNLLEAAGDIQTIVSFHLEGSKLIDVVSRRLCLHLKLFLAISFVRKQENNLDDWRNAADSEALCLERKKLGYPSVHLQCEDTEFIHILKLLDVVFVESSEVTYYLSQDRRHAFA